MKIIDYFNRIYLINLPYRKGRRLRAVWQLKQAGLWDAQKTRIFSAIRPVESEGFPNIGARGCFLSHLAVLKLAKEERLNNVLIVEDDLMISPRFKRDEERLVDQLRQVNWGFVYFGHYEEPLLNAPTTLKPFSEPLITTHFYGLSASVFDRLIVFLDELQLRQPRDPRGGPMYMSGAHVTFRMRNTDILTLVASPSLGRQIRSRTDLGGEKWFDRVPVLNTILESVRILIGVVEFWIHWWLRR